MTWPDYLPTVDCGRLVDLDGWSYEIAPREARTPLARRLQEAERRVVFLEWLLHASQLGRTMRLIDDSFVGVLYCLSAVREQMGVRLAPDSHPLLLRGLITLRHLEAHVRPGAPPPQVHREIVEHIRTSYVASAGRFRWILPEVTREEWSKLERSTQRFFPETDLEPWAELTREASIEVHLKDGLRQLVRLANATKGT